MLLQWIWFLMMAASLVYACFTNCASQMLSAAIHGSAESISMIVNLGAGYLLFCGLIEIVKALHVPECLNRLLSPLLRLLLPSVKNEKTMQAVTMNLSANLLGLGNAATPMGIQAMTLMETERKQNPSVSHAMNMLLILNATGIQLIPTGVLTLRIAAGSAAPNAVLLPTLLCTAVSAIVGVGLGLLCKRRMERHHG